MKKTLFVIFVLFSQISTLSQTTRILTYNIRYANNNPGEEWDLRKDNLANLIELKNPDIFGVQEAVYLQIEFLANKFNNFKQIGVGRDDGIMQGEFSALFISDKFSVEKNGTFWISETPEIPSLGWGASYKRIATWAVIIEKIQKDTLFVMNTHLDHQSILARNEGVKLILSKIEELAQNYPIILMGDFNFTSDFDGYKNLINSKLLNDSQFETDKNIGQNITFNGFNHKITEGEKIDYIFVSPKISVLSHSIAFDQFDEKFPSDHMPVFIDFELKK